MELKRKSGGEESGDPFQIQGMGGRSSQGKQSGVSLPICLLRQQPHSDSQMGWALSKVSFCKKLSLNPKAGKEEWKAFWSTWKRYCKPNDTLCTAGKGGQSTTRSSTRKAIRTLVGILQADGMVGVWRGKNWRRNSCSRGIIHLSATSITL